MNEEKELTNEEIIKDIERSTGMQSYWKKIVLDLIHHQKAEIERLTEENKHLNKLNEEKRWEEFSFSKKIVAENKELQKQVNELNDMCLDCPYKVKFDEIEKKAVKDTAKEILTKIDNLTLCIIDGSKEFEKGYFQAITDLKTAIKDLIKEHYSVKVE